MLQVFKSVSSKICELENKYNRRMAVTYAFISQVFFILLFSCVGLMRQGYTTQQIITGRMFIGYILNFIFCRLQKISIYPENSFQLKIMIFNGIFGSITMIIVFQSFKLLNLSDAFVMSNTNPIWTSFLAAYFLDEKLTTKSVFFCLLSFMGIILIVRPAFIFGDIVSEIQIEGRDQFLGCILGLVGSIFISILQVIGRKMQHSMKINNAKLLMYNYISSSLICGIVQMNSPNNDFQISTFYLYMIVIIGLSGYLASLLYSRTYTLEKASIISPLQYTEIIFSFIIDIVFFKEQIFLTSIIGSALVIVGSVAILI